MQSTSARHALSEDVTAVVRIAMKEHTGEDARDDDMVRFISDNMTLFTERAREGQISQTIIDQLKQLITSASENAPQRTETDTRQTTCDGNDTIILPCGSIDGWLDMLEKIHGICEAKARIGNFLKTLTLPGLSKSPALFTLLDKLPKVPRPGWVSPARLGRNQNGGSCNPSPVHIQIGHAYAWTTTGVLLSPTDTAMLYGGDMKRILWPPIHDMLTELQRKRFFSLVAKGTELVESKRAHTAEKQEKATRGTEPVQAKPTLMEVMEAYYGIMWLIMFYGPFPGPAFAETRGVLYMLRRVLQKELNDAIVRTDFNRYYT